MDGRRAEERYAVQEFSVISFTFPSGLYLVSSKSTHVVVTFIASLAILATTALAGAGLLWYKSQLAQQAASQEAPPEVSEAVGIASPEKLSYRPLVSAVGTVVAPEWIALKAEVSGKVAAIHIRSGDVVEKDQLLLELDTSVEMPSLHSAEAKRRMAESNAKRLRQAFAGQAVTESELEQTESELAYAIAETERLEALINRKRLRSPFNARVGLIHLSLGQYLTEGVEITTLQGINDYTFIDFSIPQMAAHQVEIGQTASVLVQNQQMQGSVIAKEARSDKATRNLQFRVRLDNPPKSISPNDSVKVNLEYGSQTAAMSIPVESLRRSPTGTQVFVAVRDPKGVLRATMRSIETGQTVGNKIVVLQGLEENDLVVARGSFKLREGIAIRDIGTSPSDETTTKSTSGTTDAESESAS